MNRNVFYSLLFMVIITLSCSKELVTIGVSVGDFSSDRWSQEPQIFQDEAATLGATVLFEYAYGDANAQIEQAKKLIASGIKVLIVFPANADNWAEVVDAAHKAGVIVIAYERMLQNANVDYYFTFF